MLPIPDHTVAPVLTARQRLGGNETGPLSLLIESMLSCAGRYPYLRTCFSGVASAVRNQGGLLIADEVQVGSVEWGPHVGSAGGVIPNIVVMVSRSEMGAPWQRSSRPGNRLFVQGHGVLQHVRGNPVSCAIGMAVMDVIEKRT